MMTVLPLPIGTIGSGAFAGALAWAARHNKFIDIAIFVSTYVGMAIGGLPGTRLDRASIATLGAVAALLFHRMTFQQAMNEINFPTLALLVSMMVISAQLRLAGYYDWVVRRIVDAGKSPRNLLAFIMLSAALLSALFANDVICLIFTPVLCLAMRRAGRDPIPYLMALAVSANIGSAATVIGNPQNMLIGQTGNLSFAAFTLTVLPLVVVSLALAYVAVATIYHRRIFREPVKPVEIPTDHPAAQQVVTRWSMIHKTLVIMGLLLVAMVAGEWIGLSRPVAALAAAGLVLISRKTRPRDLFTLVDWNLILLFIGLFIVIGDAQRHALLAPAMHAIAHAGISLKSHGPLAATTLVLSNLVSNVPAVLLLKPAIPVAATSTWYLLAVVSTFAGNLTLLGSIANLIVAEQAKQFSINLRFTEYLKVGVPLTLVSTSLAVVYFHFIH